MTPKQYFLQNKLLVKAHNDYTEGELFRTSKEAALLQLQENLLGGAAMGEHAMSNYARLEGARLFLQVFTNLGKVNAAESPIGLPPNLNH
jgi:hypothetical protein